VPVGVSSLIYRYTISGVDKVSIDTTSDASQAGSNDWTNGDVLEVFMLMRTDEAVAQSRINLVINNDATAIYDDSFVRDLNATVSGNTGVGLTGSPLQAAGASQTASYYSAISVRFPAYMGTSAFKVGEVLIGTPDSTAANSVVWAFSIAYRQAVAISRLAISPNTGGAKLKIGSSLAVYKRTAG
jgi:hypothetical protein